MKILNNQQIQINEWERFVQTNSYSSPFQTPQYYSFFNSVEGFSADVFAIVDNSETIQALILVTIQKEKGLKARFSKRGIVYGGPLLTDPVSAKLLLKGVREYYKSSLIYLETRNFFDYSKFKSTFHNEGWIYQPWLNYHLATPSEILVKGNMSSSRWRQIKKGIKNGGIIREASNLQEVRGFYEILSNLYKTKVKKPLLSWNFFKTFFEKNTGKYFIVYHENKIIGGIMCPIFNNRAIYEFYVCGLDNEFRELYPSTLATWAAIDHAINNNLEYFDFMGAGQPDESYGVREFKMRFGGEEVEHGRFLAVLNKPKFELGKIGLKVLSTIRS